jgi:hypothetical protein
MAALDGIRAKIDRAIEQLDSLETEAKATLERDPVPITQDRNAEGWNVLRMAPITLPLRWTIIMGEIIHDLRSALDHLIWQLVLANNQVPSRANQFPVFSEGTVPTWASKDWKQRKASWARALQGVHLDDVALIKALQPYKRRDRLRFVPIEVLTLFSNTDKHQTPLPTATITVPWERRVAHFPQVPEGVSIEEVSVPNPGIHLVAHEMPLLAVRIKPPDAAIKMVMREPIIVSVAFGQGGHLPLGNVRDLISEVQRIVGLFEGRLA